MVANLRKIAERIWDAPIREELEYITPLEVQHGDILIVQGYRVCATNPRSYPEFEACYYVLNSDPTAHRPQPLPRGYEGMGSGGNRLMQVVRVKGANVHTS